MRRHNWMTQANRRLGRVVLSVLFTGLSAAPALAQDWTSTQIGDFEFHDFSNGVSGTSTQIGDFEFHDFSNGVSGTSTQIGDFEFHDFSDGTRCTTTSIGIFSFTSCD